MSINTNINDNPATIQYGSYGRIEGDTNFPSTSVFRTKYPDSTQAYYTSASPISAFDVQVFPKYAVLTYNVGNAPGANASGSGNVSVTEGFLLPGNTNITPLTGSGNYQRLIMYPYKSFTGGVFALNTGNMNVGRSSTFLPDSLSASNISSVTPLVYQLPTGQQMPVSSVNIKLAVSSDGIFYSFT